MNYGREIDRLRKQLQELERKQASPMPFVRQQISWPCYQWPPSCPTCRGEMLGVIGKYGKFYGCRKFPHCRGSRNLDGSDGREPSVQNMSDDGHYPEPDPDDDSYPPSFCNGDY